MKERAVFFQRNDYCYGSGLNRIESMVVSDCQLIDINDAIEFYEIERYLFKNKGTVIAEFIGSANCSSSGLDTTKNSELLMDVVNPSDIAELEAYEREIRRDSLHYDDPSIIVNTSSAGKPLRTRGVRSSAAPKSWNCYSGNPFSAIIPLYYKLDPKGTISVEQAIVLSYRSFLLAA